MSILRAAWAAMAPSAAVDVTPDAVNWADISGSGFAANANQTISGIGTSISIGASLSGSGILSYSLNGGSFTAYSTPISVSNSNTLRWQVDSISAVSGTVTVTNQSAGGATLDTFTYNIT